MDTIWYSDIITYTLMNYRKFYSGHFIQDTIFRTLLIEVRGMHCVQASMELVTCRCVPIREVSSFQRVLCTGFDGVG